MLPPRCPAALRNVYEALLHYRKQRCAERSNLSESDGPSATAFSGINIARLFSAEVAKSLSAAEWRSLMQFVQDRTSNHDVEFLESKVSSLLSRFTTKETSLTGQPVDRLAAPSGQGTAGLSLVMHIQSKKGAIQGFLDEGSPSIQTLAAKGLQSNFIFGFDWHHRAEGEARDRGRVDCPARHGPGKWSKEQLILHDRLSENLLELLPLPLLIIAGSCAKQSYRKTIDVHARHLKLIIQPGAAIVLELEGLRASSMTRTSWFGQSNT